MLLNCPTCARSYTVSHAEIGEAGRTVICPSCRTQWFARGSGVLAATNDDSREAPRRKRLETAAQLAAGRSAPDRGRFRRARAAVLAIASLALVTGLVGQRERIVRHAPRTASLYSSIGLGVNVSGLAFASVAPQRLASSDVTVAGAIRNVTGRRVTVPRIAYEVRDAIGTPLLSWSEAVASKTLDAGKTLAFESSPHHMPADSRTVSVRFVTDDSMTRRRVAEDSGE